MKLGVFIARRLRRALDFATALHTCAGSFHHRGLRVWHLGILLDQWQIAELVDLTIAELGKQGHKSEVVEALLARCVVRVTQARPVLDGMAVEQFGRWTGGVRDRGEICLRFDEDLLPRLGALLRALLLHELAPGQVARPERVY